MEFKDRLKQIRLENNISQEKLATAINVNQTTISTWELGKKLPDYNNIVALAKFFKTTSDYLLGLEN